MCTLHVMCIIHHLFCIVDLHMHEQAYVRTNRLQMGRLTASVRHRYTRGRAHNNYRYNRTRNKPKDAKYLASLISLHYYGHGECRVFCPHIMVCFRVN